MKYIEDCRELQLNHTAVALGKFDGIHLGHALLLEHVKHLQAQGYTGVVFTFDMKENHIFDVHTMKTIYTRQEKRELMEETGIDYMVEYPFDDAFAAMQPEQFIQKILVQCLDARYIIVGSDFRFGHNRIGNVEMLRFFGKKYGFHVIVAEKKRYGDLIISSTYIRRCIKDGAVDEAAALMNRPYFMTGIVTEGRRLGRTIGVPTANLLPEKGKLYPSYGVYASRILLPDQRVLYGITNIGDNPTVDIHNPSTIETCILDFTGDLYGKEIRIALLEKLREEKKFDSLDALKVQIHADISFVRKKYLIYKV